MRRRIIAAAALLLCTALVGISASPAADSRSGGLREAWAAPGAQRSVFFIRGMSCRACTMLIDRHLIREKGVYWLRFNYPLRLMVLYHDPVLFPEKSFVDFMAQTGELTAVLLGSGPAKDARPDRGDPAAIWKGGTLSLDEAREASGPFEETLKGTMIERGTEEWNQVAYEIAGEAVRSRIFLSLAGEAGYGKEGERVELPQVVAKDFYWPVELLPLTVEESAVARYLYREVLGGEEDEKSRERFDSWLHALWQERALDFGGEVLELPE